MMVEQKKVSTKPVARTPRKLVPRPAAKKENVESALPVAEAKKPVTSTPRPKTTVRASAPAPKTEPAQSAKATPAKKIPEKAPEKVAKVAKPTKAVKPGKEAKPPKARKLKLVRDSYAMPEAEYAMIGTLKKRLAAQGSEFKKSELLRAGIAALTAMSDVDLKTLMASIERIKTGRPAK